VAVQAAAGAPVAVLDAFAAQFVEKRSEEGEMLGARRPGTNVYQVGRRGSEHRVTTYAAPQ